MSLDKAIEHGKEKRKPYRGSKVFDYTCRNHGGKGKKHDGGQCPWCRENRLYQVMKERTRTDEELKESIF